MKISVLHPSRGRPERAEESMRKMMVAASGNIEYEYILVFDVDDPCYAKYAAIIAPKLIKIPQPSGTCISALNIAVEKATGDLFVQTSDNVEHMLAWNEHNYLAVREILNTPAVLHVDDGYPAAHHWCTFPPFTRKYVESTGHTPWYPGYFHYYMDVEFYDEAVIRGAVVKAPQIHLKYKHPIFGGIQTDETYQRLEAKKEQDRILYEHRKKTGFLY